MVKKSTRHGFDSPIRAGPGVRCNEWGYGATPIATIKKMVGPFGATINEADYAVILDYLAKNYSP